MASTTTKNLLLSQIKSVSSDIAGPVYLVHTTEHNDDATIYKIEIPGVDPSTVDVHFEDNLLHVYCERGELNLSLDPTIDISKIKADVKWGLLAVTVPVPAKPLAQSIRVNIHNSVEKKSSIKTSEASEE